MSKKLIELDVVFDNDMNTHQLKTLADSYNLTTRLVASNGPNNTPVYEFVGEKADLLKYVVEIYCENEDFFNEFAEDYGPLHELKTKLQSEMHDHFKNESVEFMFWTGSERGTDLEIKVVFISDNDRKFVRSFLKLFVGGTKFHLLEEKATKEFYIY